jgi:acyl-CoA reductase-like NAD-dependent aldehyde dehydrogenase
MATIDQTAILERERHEALDDTMYGLGAGVWTRDMNRAYRMGRAIKAGRVWTNCYHQYPAHAAFGATRHPASGARTTRWCSTTIRRRNVCWSATTITGSASEQHRDPRLRTLVRPVVG